MKDDGKSKKRTLNELEELRHRVAELESEVEEHKRLHEMAQECQNIIESSQDMIAVVNQHYRYLLVNSRFLDYRGLNRGQVVGRLVEEVLGQDVFEKEVKEKLDACLRGESVQYVMKYTYPGLGERELLVSYSPIEDSDGINRVVSTIRDITDSKRAEDALLKTEERLKLALAAAHMGVWEWNVQTNAIIWSQECYKIYGVECSDGTLKSFTDLLHPEDGSRIKTMIDRALADRTTQASEYRIIRPSGEVVWISDFGQAFFDETGKPLRMVGIVQDITERKRAEGALRESEEKLRLLFDKAPVGYHEVDTEGRVTRINRTELDLLGYSLEDVIGRPIWKLCVDEDTVIKAFKDKIAGKVPPGRAFERSYRRKDGTPLLVLSEDRILRDEDGRAIGIRTTLQDINERKQAEEALQKSEEQAKQLAQENSIMAEIGRIISSTLNIEEVYKLFSEKVGELIPFDRIGIGVISLEENTVSFPYIDGISASGRQPGDIVPLAGTAAEKVMQTRKSHLFRMESEEEIAIEVPGLLPEFRSGIRSALTVPLVSRDQVIGMLSLRSTIPGAYTDRDLKLAERIGSQIAGAIANAQLYGRLRETEESLRRSEGKFRELYDSAPVGYHEFDREGRITNVNRTDQEMLGYSREELIGEYVWKFTLEEDIAHREILEKLADFRPPGQSFERTYRRKDGTTLPVLLQDRLNKDEQGRITGMRVAIQDITEQKRTGEALRESEEALRVFVNANPESSLLIDVKGTILIANESLSKRLGKSLDEIIGSCLYDLLPEDIVNQRKPHFDEVFRTGKSLRFEDMRMDKYYETFVNPVFDPEGNVTKVAIVGFDITGRKWAEEALLKSEERFRDLFDHAPVGYYELDSKGLFTNLNQTELEMLGYRLEEMIGQPVWKFNEDEGTARKRVLEKLAGVAPPSNGLEGSYRCKDGTTFPVLIEDRLLKDSAGKIIGLRGTIQDITDRKKAAQEMGLLQEELHQAQKMEAIGTLAGGIAHDFNNILSAILGYAELASLDTEEGTKAKYNLEHSMKAANRAKDLVQQILAFSRQGRQERKLLNIKPIVKEGLKFLRASLPATIEIRQEIEEDLEAIEADPTQVHQVLMNLCTNAAHAMDERGGVLEVSLSNLNLDRENSALAGIEPVPYVRLRVSDTGHGMSPDILRRIFDPYFTTKEVGKGTGLGLAVVHGIVKSYGGEIVVSSEVGKGSTFDIYFPRIEAPSEPSSAIMAEPLSLGQHERVLFVDDEEAVVEVGREILEHLGYEVATRTSSIEALELFRVRADQFDLVITDMTMPSMTGDKLAQELLRIRPGIPIILCTGFSEYITPEKAKAMGIRELVMKPFVMKEIAKAMRRALEFEK